VATISDTGEFFSESGERIAQPEGDRVWVTDLSEKWLEDPIMGIVRDEERGLASHLPTVAGILAVWVGLLAATILLIATNAGVLGISRLSYSMGQHRQFPPKISKLHQRFRTPYMAIIFAGVVAAILIIPGKVDLLADLYSFGAMLAFTSAHVSVVVLRIKEPDLVRPFKAPFNIRIKGIEWPVTAILGGMATFGVWVIVAYTHAIGRTVGIIWLVLGFVLYAVYRRSQNLSLLETVKIEVPAPLPFPEVEYNNILVPVFGSKISREATVMALELASEENAAIEALYVVEVPMNLPLDATLPQEQAVGEDLLEEVSSLAEEYGVTLYPRIVAGRSAGRTIVDEAISRKSQIVMLGAERKRRTAERFFGRTVEYVLKKAPCKVLVVAEEKGAPQSSEPLNESAEVK
jgi:APA family basic amino acid/polyamine antiporter